MPYGDGTGPLGYGPMTGRGAGYCAGYSVPGYLNPLPRFGFGFGFGRRWRGRFWGWYPWSYRAPIRTPYWWRDYYYVPTYPYGYNPATRTLANLSVEEQKRILENELRQLEDERKALEAEKQEIEKKLKEL